MASPSLPPNVGGPFALGSSVDMATNRNPDFLISFRTRGIHLDVAAMQTSSTLSDG